jgi:hypothetical protein
VVCGLWFVVCGLCFVVCGLCFVVCGLWFSIVGADGRPHLHVIPGTQNPGYFQLPGGFWNLDFGICDL